MQGGSFLECLSEPRQLSQMTFCFDEKPWSDSCFSDATGFNAITFQVTREGTTSFSSFFRASEMAVRWSLSSASTSKIHL